MKRTLKDAAQLPRQYRTAEIEVRTVGEGDAARTTYSVAVSSESEVERWYGLEVLDHSKGSVDMSRMKNGAAVLIDHNSDQIGVVDSARIDDDKVLRADLRFSKSARGQEVEQDVKDGIRRNISVGYFVKKMKMVESRDGVEVWRVTRWTPVEVSIVSVPADATVGVGRGKEAESPVEIEDGAAVREEQTMKKVRDEKGAVIEVEDADPRTEYRAAEVTVRDEKNPTEIAAICDANSASGRISEFLTRGLTVKEVALEILAASRTKGDVQPAAEKVGEKMKRELRNYSVVRAIQRKVAEAENDGKFDGLEAEVHAEIERSLPGDVKRHGGFLMPMQVRTTLDSLTVAKGTELVQEQAGEFIELLRPQSVAISMGVRVLSGLVGPLAFPKQTAGATVYFVAENAATGVADGEPSLGLSLMAPKTIQGNIPFTRQLLQQSSIGIEAWARDELSIGHGLAIDKMVYHGRGSNGEPTGVYAAASVNSKDFTNLAGAKLIANFVDCVSAIADKNASLGTLGWVTTPLFAGLLRSNLEFLAAGSQTLWQGPLQSGTLAGYNAKTSTQVSKVMTASQPTGGSNHGLIFGNWADILLGLFGALEVVVDPYTNKKKGIIEVTTFQMADILIRHGESFTKGINAVIA